MIDRRRGVYPGIAVAWILLLLMLPAHGSAQGSPLASVDMENMCVWITDAAFDGQRLTMTWDGQSLAGSTLYVHWVPYANDCELGSGALSRTSEFIAPGETKEGYVDALVMEYQEDRLSPVVDLQACKIRLNVWVMALTGDAVPAEVYMDAQLGQYAQEEIDAAIAQGIVVYYPDNKIALGNHDAPYPAQGKSHVDMLVEAGAAVLLEAGSVSLVMQMQ